MTENTDSHYNTERIFPIPKLPDEIKKAVNRDRLVVFIGAGVSRIIGCKGWSELGDKLVDVCFDGNCINHREKVALNREKTPKKKISIVRHILSEQKQDDLFFRTIRKHLRANPQKAERFPIYKELYKLRAVYVTTNVDECFDDLYFRDSIVYRPQDFDAGNIDRTRLYHLHGTIKDPDSMIFTTSKYLEHYSDPNIQQFLGTIFSEYTVLFIGYGMEEFEVLDFLFTKTGGSSKELKHFILLPMYRGEENILAFEEFYHGDLGIHVVSYAIDDKGYDQLHHVIENWQKEINLSSTFLHDSFEEIDRNIHGYEPGAAQRILQLVKNDLPLEDYLFRKLVSTEWLFPLKERGYFSPDRNPTPRPAEKEGYYTIPYWNVLDYLERVSNQVTEKSDPQYAQTLIEIIRSVSNYRGEGGERIDNYRTDWIFVKIMTNLPTTFVKIRDIELIRDFLDSRWRFSLVASEIGKEFLPKLLRNGERKKALKLLEIATSIKWVDRNGKEEPAPLMKESWLNDLLEKNKKEISRQFPLEAAQIIIKNMEEITSKDQSEFHRIWIPAIEDHPQNQFPNRFQNAVVRAVRDLLNAATEAGEKNAKDVLKELLQKGHPIFRRLSISAIDTNWSSCSDLFWAFADRNILTDRNLRHEVYTLFINHFNSFSDEEKNKILKWIEEGPDWKVGEEDERLIERRIAYWKQSWLSALIVSGHKPAVELYEEYKRITGTEPDHPDFASWGESRFGRISPIEVPELLQKSNEEIAEYLRGYKEDERGWPSREGLEDALYQAVKSTPSKFDRDLLPFLEVPSNYKYRIIWGFCDAWKEKKEIKWSVVLDYCKQIISSDGFWERIYQEGEYHYRNWIISHISDLLIEGTRDDTHAFAKDYLPVAEQIILTMLERTESDLRYPDDLITATLNSAKGRVSSALISYTLRVARLSEDKEVPVKWGEKIRNEFTRRLDRNIEPSPEWSVSLGEYLPHLHYLDRSWVEENINRVFPKENENHWQAAMEGYLFYARVYDPLYELLKSGGHYQKAIYAESKNKHIRERLVEHLCIGYLRGKENLADEDSLFRQCLDSWKTDDIIGMISFFWMQREYLAEHAPDESVDNELENLKTVGRKRILDFWGRVFDELKDKSDFSQDEKKILSDISKLSCFIHHIDGEKLLWLQLSAKFVGFDFDASFFIEYLDMLSDNSPHGVGIIYLTMLDYSTPDYDREHIRSIVDKLYHSGEKESANKICNSYFSKGFGFLRDIYERNKGNRDSNG
jgi:hypothetical protein